MVGFHDRALVEAVTHSKDHVTNPLLEEDNIHYLEVEASCKEGEANNSYIRHSKGLLEEASSNSLHKVKVDAIDHLLGCHLIDDDVLLHRNAHLHLVDDLNL